MLEAALSCATPLLEAALSSAATMTPLLTSVTIPAPLALAPRSLQVLECSVVLAGSAAGVTVQSIADTKRSTAVHIHGGYGALGAGT